ncbi:MAG: tetratricopeptide repeat protein [Rhodanobacter sp.]
MATKAWGAALAAALLVVGCASDPAVKEQTNVVLSAPAQQDEASADVAEVLRGVQMIIDGHAQAAIDGPLDTVVNRYEAKYNNRREIYFSARSGADTLLYAVLPASQKSSKPAVVLGPAWAMAYWGRGYAYNELGRYDEALIELKKALALAPFDTQYNVEIGYSYQQQHRWDESIEHYRSAADFASISVAESEVKAMTCRAFRGQGYDLTELRRYDEARAAYRNCLKLIPDEPTSLAELKYIDGTEARGKATSR